MTEPAAITAARDLLRAALTEQDQLRGATEMIDDRLRIERLVRANARRAMVIDIIERLVENPEREDFGPSDMEYWSPLHDALQAKLRAALAEQEVDPVAWVWNPASKEWERVRAFGRWQQGAIYAFGPTVPTALVEPEAEPFLWYEDDTGDTWTPGAVKDGGAPDGLRPLYAEPIKQDVPATSFGNVEPDAWLYETPMPDRSVFVGASTERLEIGVGVPTGSTERPLYTAPPRREWKGLTDEEIAVIASTPCAVVGSYVHTFARAIEAALKEKNG